MKYDPLRIVSYCGDDVVPPDRHLWSSFADAGYDFFLRGDIKSALPVFQHNQIYICFDPRREDRNLKIGGGNIIPTLLYSYDRSDIKDFLRTVYCRYAKMLSTSSLCVYGCTADEFMRDENVSDALEVFSEIVIRHEYCEGAPMPYEVSPRHSERRRPCRYPFEWLILDEEGNVRQCPYCHRVLTSFRGMDVLKRDPALLHCLAAQLLMVFDEFPECRNCRCWLDGWLGDEKKTVEYRQGCRAIVVHHGRFSHIFREEGK